MADTIQHIAPSRIKANGLNPSGRTDDVAELAASIKAVGILEPLVVAPTSGTAFAVVFGHRRLAAAKIAKLSTVPCLVREDLKDPAAQLETMLVENIQRCDLTPLEEAKAYQQLLEFPGYTIKRITDRTGRAAATVKKRLALTKLADRVQRKLQLGQITLGDAQALTEFADDEPALRRLEQNIGGSNWRFTLQHERDRRDRDRKTAKNAAALAKAGVSVLDQAALRALDEAADDGIGYVYLGDDDEFLSISVEDHAACPGHAAELDPNGRIDYVCTSPHTHPAELASVVNAIEGGGDAEGTPDERAARKAAVAENGRIEAELQSAATVRRSHLGAVISGPDPTKAAAAQAILVDLIVDKIRRGPAREVLADVFGKKSTPKLADELRGKLESLLLEDLILCLDVANFAQEERMLEKPTGWRPNDWGDGYSMHATAEWRKRLVDVYGYVWSQPEIDIIPPPAVIDVQLPDEAATEQAS